MKPVLEVKNLSVSYSTYGGKIQSVRDISFEIESGKTTAIVGESGCGKSVTAKAVMGLIEKPGYVDKNSQIIYNGNHIEDISTKEWNQFRGRKCSMIFQDASVSLNPTMNVGKQVMENLKNHFTRKEISRQKIHDAAQDMLDLVGIPDAKQCMKKFPHELSGGMRQRIMIATAMLTKPEILIADEPTTALDVTIQAQILDLMKNLQKQFSMAIIIITHDLGVVADIADEILVMYAGKIVERGNYRDIFYHPSHPYTWALLKSVPHLDMDEKKPLISIEGSIPDMTHPPAGCAFCDRCPYAMNICTKLQPEETRIGDGHTVSCWLSDRRANKSDLPFATGGSLYEC